jgi:hypothetical protein
MHVSPSRGRRAASSRLPSKSAGLCNAIAFQRSALWFEAADFEAVVGRIKAMDARIEADVHMNPNAGHREIWLRDLDGYLVVFAEPYSWAI